ncbi:hypothetical protein [Aeromonas sp. 603696]|uniref:hypothetical protein n=1 Tax=Aeromonas sp. 603696 TaxID=2712049 RepID=UPI003BA284A1
MKNLVKIFTLLLSSSQVMANTPVRYIERASDIVILSVENHPDFLAYTPDITYVNITNLGGTSDGVLAFNNDVPFLPSRLLDGYKLDVWEDGPIPFPYVGLLCDSNGSNKQGCIGKNTRVRPAQIDSKGFYGFSDPSSRTVGLLSKLSQSAFWYLRDMPVGTSVVRDLNYCIYQDKNNSNRCTAQTGPVDWRVRKLTTNKVGHIKLVSKDINEEIVIDSNGNPLPAPGGSGSCVADTVIYAKGISCTVASYQLDWNGTSSSPLAPFFFSARKITLYDKVAFKFANEDWVGLQGSNYSSSQRVREQRGTSQIKMFLSSNLIKNMANDKKLNIDNIAQLITSYTNSPLDGLRIPFKGGFEFIPRAQTVSIKSADGNPSPYQTGEVGKDNLVFNYELSETGYTNAARLEVKVTQDVGIPHQGRCTFYPDGQIESSRAVPVPTSIIFNSVGNQPVSTPIECNGPPIDLRSRKIIESRPAQEWDEGGIGYTRFYDLGLQFSLTDNMTRKTVSGDDWEGLVHQSGKIILTGLWN